MRLYKFDDDRVGFRGLYDIGTMIVIVNIKKALEIGDIVFVSSEKFTNKQHKNLNKEYNYHKCYIPAIKKYGYVSESAIKYSFSGVDDLARSAGC